MRLEPFRFFVSELLQWIGERSYSLYLWHWPVLVLAAAALERSLAWHEMRLRSPSLLLPSQHSAIASSNIRYGDRGGSQCGQG